VVLDLSLVGGAALCATRIALSGCHAHTHTHTHTHAHAHTQAVEVEVIEGMRDVVLLAGAAKQLLNNRCHLSAVCACMRAVRCVPMGSDTALLDAIGCRRTSNGGFRF
jgi:hypothetical protein